MNKLKQLLNELCEEGVEYVFLGDVVNILDNLRKPVKKTDRIKGEYPYYGANGVQDYVDNYIFDGTFILMGEDGSVINGDNTPVLTWAEGKIWVNNHAHIMSEVPEKALLRYVYFCLSKTDVRSIVRGMPPKINQQSLRNIKIPLPNLAVQKEIIRILDNFEKSTSKLIDKLMKETLTRKKQYRYYLDDLLSFGDEIVKVSFGDIGTLTRGNGLQKSDFVEIGVGCIHYGEIYTYYKTVAKKTKSFVSPELAAKLQKVNKGDIIIAVTSENIEDVCKCVIWDGEEEIVTGGHTAILKHNQNSKYIAYYMQSTDFFRQKYKIAQGTKVIEVSPKKLNELRIPIPPIEKQEEIVNIINDLEEKYYKLNSNLLNEIEYRKRQYRHFRNNLLTFEETYNEQF